MMSLKRQKSANALFFPELKAFYKFTDDEILFTDEGFAAAAEMSDDAGARISGKNIEKVLSVANARLEKGQKGPIIIDREFVKIAVCEAGGQHKQRVIGFSGNIGINKKEVG